MPIAPPITIVLPTGVDFILLASENITDNLRKGADSNLELPSLYRLAFQVVNETDEAAVTRRIG